METNKNDANKAAVLLALQHVRSALENEAQNAATTAALDQCDRLKTAIEQFHAEALRFAAFTLLRIVQRSGTVFTEPVQNATLQLKTALETAGYPH
jgi:hypothetical protein